MEGLSIGLLVCIFVASGIVTWLAGVSLTKTTDSLDKRFNLGDAMGGLILLGITGSLPEIAVVTSAARAGHIPVIIGTLIGGLAIQTLLIVFFDIAVGKKRPLSYLAGTWNLTFETLFAIILTAIACFAVFKPQINLGYVSPLSLLMVVGWFVGLYLINKARKIDRFNKLAEDAKPGRKHHERRKGKEHIFYAGKSTLYVLLIFLGASVATLAAGWALEESGNAIADALHIGSGVFAATFIALGTSVPEISTGLESVFIGDNHLAVSDIVGGNAFMLVLFLLGDLVARRPVLKEAYPQDIGFAALAVLMMAVYAVSFVKRPTKCFLRMGIDSVLQIVLYVVGIVVLMGLPSAPQ
jgi:cation:H+ antiporter